MPTMARGEPFDVEDVVGWVKGAIRAANLSGAESGTDVFVTELDLADLESELSQAVRMVRAGVAAAALGDPGFDLRTAVVEIGFGITETGGLRLTSTADTAADWAQSLRLSLGARHLSR